MKNFLLVQPFVAVVLLFAFAAQASSPILAFALLILLIAALVALLYIAHNRRLRQLERVVADLKIDAKKYVPISAGGLDVNLLVFAKDALHIVSRKGMGRVIAYSDITKITAKPLEVTFAIECKDGSSQKFRLSMMKSKKEVLSSASGIQSGVGAVSLAGAPLLSLLSSMQISAASARNRSEALIRDFREFVGVDVVIDEDYNTKVKKSDVILGLLISVEVIALVILFVVLLYAPVKN
jgi:hypothetical protein